MSFVRPLLLGLGLAFVSPVAFAAPVEASIEVQRRIEAENGIKIGERSLDAGPLTEFYRQRAYRLAWSGPSEPKGDRLLLDLQAIAVAEGLAPETYTVPTTASDIDRDLLVSDTVARFARDLAIGRTNPTRALGGMGPETLAPVDVTKFLLELAGGKDLLGLIEQLPPPYAGYQRLKAAMEQHRQAVRAGGWTIIPDGPSIKAGMEDGRLVQVRKRLIATGELAAGHDKGKVLDDTLAAALKRFQSRHGIEPDGAIGKQTLAALNVSADDRLRQIMVNMERWRWMPKALDGVHIAVNIPAAHLEFVRDGRIAMAMRVVVGDVKHQTPTMMTAMNAVVVNPTWTVPPSIATKEILPKLRKDPAYLVSNNMHILGEFPENSPESQGVGIDWNRHGGKFPWRLRQRPGPDNALGQVKFVLSNSDDIYLHDTPKRQYFGRIFRALSHGCVRLERPIDLAQAVLSPDWSAKVPELIAEANTRSLKLDRPITVYLMYMTAWADEDGTVHFRDDLYGHDARLRAALKRPRALGAARVAQDGPAGAL